MPSRALIALLSTYYRPVLGGVETATERLAKFLRTRGEEVLVVTKRASRAHPAEEVVDGVPVERVPPVGERRSSGKWLAIPAFFAALWRRRRVLDVIVCVDYRGIGIAALMAGSLTGTPVVFETSTDGTISGESIRRRVSRLGASPDGRLAKTLTWPVRAVYRQADLFICVSRSIERELRECGVPPTRIEYLPHSVDTTTFRPVAPEAREALRRVHGVPVDATVAIFVGRLSQEKGVLELVDAWTGLDIPGATLILVGPDMTDHPWDAGAPARRRVADRGLAGSVLFVGAVPPEHVPAWLQLADVAVQPSHFEAFGIAALEAMASGLPLVTTDVGGFRDYVEDGINGIRVPPRDVVALRRALSELLTDAALRARLGRAAVETASRFDDSAVLSRLAQALETVRNSHGEVRS